MHRRHLYVPLRLSVVLLLILMRILPSFISTFKLKILYYAFNEDFRVGTGKNLHTFVFSEKIRTKVVPFLIISHQ